MSHETTSDSTSPSAFRLLVIKEWRHVLQSPKFVAASLVVTVAVLLAVVLGMREHRAFEAQQQAAERLVHDEQSQAADWMSVRHRVFRPADPLQIFVAGVHRDLGRYAPISRGAPAALIHSVYGDEPIFAVFRTFDLAFVVSVVLSLFAIVFTYDAVCGEREAGTLRLLAAYAVPRSVLLTAKAVGLWLALLIPVLLAGLLGLALVLGAGVELAADAWARLGVFAAAAFLYLTFFIVLGVAVSAHVKRSTTAFLGLLAFWILVVLILPRAGLVAAVQAVPVPSPAQVAAQRQGFENRAWEENLRAMAERWDRRNAELRALPEAERQEAEDVKMWGWMEQDDEARRATEAEIQAFADRLQETVGLRREAQRRYAFSLARISPAATFDLVATRAAGTGVELAERWSGALGDYRGSWKSWLDDASGGEGGSHVMRRRSGGGGMLEDTSAPVDLSDMPRFVAPAALPAAAAVPMDLGLLLLETVLAFAVAWVGMLRYDVR